MDDAQAPAVQGIVLPIPAGHKRIEFDQKRDNISVSYDYNDQISVYRVRAIDADDHFKADTWWGTEYRLDAQGRRWSCQLPTMVQDDFGNLVAVAE